ncbi:MAG: hypothetical protein ACYDH6_21995 [Acidimicrobiales bacterium]
MRADSRPGAIALVGATAAVVFVAAVIVAVVGPGSGGTSHVASTATTTGESSTIPSVSSTVILTTTAAPKATVAPTTTTVAPFVLPERWAYIGSSPVVFLDLSKGTEVHPTSGGDNFSVSPDRSRVAMEFRTDPASPAEPVFIAGAGGTSPRQVSDPQVDKSEGALTWSPDGSRLAYISQIAQPSGANSEEVVVVNADGTGRRQLTTGADIHIGTPSTNLAWTGDGTRIAFVAGSNGSAVRTVDVATGTIATVVNDDTLSFRCLAFRPNGLLLVQELAGGVVEVAADGASLRRVTPAGQVTASFSLSPDGTTVAYAGPNGVLTTIPVSGGASKAFSSHVSGFDPPVWSADGRAVLVTDAQSVDPGVRAVRVSDGTVTVIHHGEEVAAAW